MRRLSTALQHISLGLCLAACAFAEYIPALLALMSAAALFMALSALAKKKTPPAAQTNRKGHMLQEHKNNTDSISRSA